MIRNIQKVQNYYYKNYLVNEKKILITSGDEFIGSHVVDKFLSLNYEVKSFVMHNSFNSAGWINENNKKLEIFFGDIRDSENVEKSMKII